MGNIVITEISGPQAELMDKFSKLMVEELSANGHKGDITSWEPSVYDLIAEISYHMAKTAQQFGTIKIRE